jgi:hypothetical protein
MIAPKTTRDDAPAANGASERCPSNLTLSPPSVSPVLLPVRFRFGQRRAASRRPQCRPPTHPLWLTSPAACASAYRWRRAAQSGRAVRRRRCASSSCWASHTAPTARRASQHMPNTCDGAALTPALAATAEPSAPGCPPTVCAVRARRPLRSRRRVLVSTQRSAAGRRLC